MTLNSRSAKTKVLILLAGIALAGCTNPDRFGSDYGDANGGYGSAPDGANYAPGSADDPSSVAHFQQRIGDRVLFVVDQSSLTPEGRATLDAQASWLLVNPDYQAVIEGHADEQGTREYNLALGARRANAVMEYLVAKGVPADRMKFVSYGKERPLEVCSEETCYSQNRRAVTILSTSLTG